MFSVFGTTYIKAFERIKKDGEDHLSVLMNDHYMIHLALEYCHAMKVPTLGELLPSIKPNDLFCSTEDVIGCGDSAYNAPRASNKTEAR